MYLGAGVQTIEAEWCGEFDVNKYRGQSGIKLGSRTDLISPVCVRGMTREFRLYGRAPAPKAFRKGIESMGMV